jgi:hypothetical protein
LVFVLLLAAGVRLRAAWLSRAVVGAAFAVFVGVAAVNPEALMASTHINRIDRNYPVDVGFLGSLSADAIDDLDALPEPRRSCVLASLAHDLERGDPWYAWNPSRERARRILHAKPPLRCS